MLVALSQVGGEQADLKFPATGSLARSVKFSQLRLSFASNRLPKSSRGPCSDKSVVPRRQSAAALQLDPGSRRVGKRSFEEAVAELPVRQAAVHCQGRIHPESSSRSWLKSLLKWTSGRGYRQDAKRPWITNSLLSIALPAERVGSEARLGLQPM